MADQEELNKAQRNAECCAKNMGCCVKVQPPPIEIRAVMVRCPNLGPSEANGHVSRTMNKPVMAANEFSIKSFQGFDEDEPLIQSRVTDCRSKIIMTMKLHHKGAIVCKSQYIVVDHVYDPVTEKSARLLNPYVIRLRQEPVSKSFHLKFVDYVNSEAREEVYNKQDANFTGCYTSPRKSTCGIVKFDGKPIPYSEGFCCSCDTKKNLQRQPDSHNDKNEEIISYSDPAFLLDRVGCPRNYYSDIGLDQLVSGNDVMNLTTRVTPAGRGGTCSGKTTETEETEPTCSTTCAPESEPQKRATGGTSSKNRWTYTTYSSLRSEHHHSTTYHPFYLSMKRELNTDGTNANTNKESQAYLKKMSTIGTKMNNRQQYMDDIKKSHNSAPYLNPVDETRDQFTDRLARKMRQTFPSGVQKRGGQSCADRYTPPGKDPEHYHESAHCLRFSDVWYGIYNLGEPNIEQIVYLNIYERFETPSRSDKWREVTNGTIRLGNRFVHYEDELPTISMTFSAKTLTDTSLYDNWDLKRILIPEGVRACDINKYAEMRGGPDEYLVVPASRIALEGEHCDRIGVGFEAFFKQPMRCGTPRGTCLHNQPKHLWRNDKLLETKNKKGCYFLKYHANITQHPLFVNESTGEKYLFVEYEGAHITIIDIEIKADQNSVIRDIANAAITEVYVDSTCGKYTIITIKVINTGLISTKFMVQLTDFPLELPEYFSKIRSKLVMIAPQTLHIFNLEIKATLPSDLMYCSVEVLNKRHELVALRRVRIQKFDRCVCGWYCLCACVATINGLRCNPMSLEHYHAAGFEGALPIVTYMIHFTMLDDLVSVAFYFVLFLLGILLLLGLFKAILGLWCIPVGMWGLPVVLDLPKPMKRYYERALRNEKVVYDDNGWPVNPKTHCRARNMSIATAFCSNLVFFYTYPLACTVIIFRRLCCPYYTRRRCPGSPRHRPGCSCRRKKHREHPCGDPKCDSKKCVRKKRLHKKRSKYETDSSEGHHHFHNLLHPHHHDDHDQTPRSSHTSTKSHKSDGHHHHHKHHVVAGFQYSPNKTPFAKAAEHQEKADTHYEKADSSSLLSTVSRSFYSSTTAVTSPAEKGVQPAQVQPSFVSSVTFGKTKDPEEVAAVTTSSEYEETTTPRTKGRGKPKMAAKRTAGHRSSPPSTSSRTSLTSHDLVSNATSRTQTGSVETSTSESILAESVAVQTREGEGNMGPASQTNSALKATFKSSRPKSM